MRSADNLRVRIELEPIEKDTFRVILFVIREVCHNHGIGDYTLFEEANKIIFYKTKLNPATLGQIAFLLGYNLTGIGLTLQVLGDIDNA